MTFEAEDAELEDLCREMLALAAKIGADRERLPNLADVEDDASWLEVYREGAGFYYRLMYTERGERSVVAGSTDRDGILRAVFQGVTQTMALRWDAKTRGAQPYSRARWFAHQEDLMGRLKPHWRETERARHAALLADDNDGEMA